MKRRTLKKVLVVSILSIVVITNTVACADLRYFIGAIFGIWFEEHADDVAKYRLTGSTGDQQVDAAISPEEALLDITEADTLMQDAKDEMDDKKRLDKMEEAVKLRPGDYRYRISTSVEALKQGDTSRSWTHHDKAIEAVTAYGLSHKMRFLNQGINELEGLKSTFEDAGFKDAAQCKAYFDQLTFYYRERHAETKDMYDWNQKERYLQDAQRCQQ